MLLGQEGGDIHYETDNQTLALATTKNRSSTGNLTTTTLKRDDDRLTLRQYRPPPQDLVNAKDSVALKGHVKVADPRGGDALRVRLHYDSTPGADEFWFVGMQEPLREVELLAPPRGPRGGLSRSMSEAHFRGQGHGQRGALPMSGSGSNV